jgi:hypothetical protein
VGLEPRDTLTNHSTSGGFSAVYSTYWQGTGVAVVHIDFKQIDFVKPTVFSYYVSSSGTPGGTVTSRYFVVEGSNDDSNWTVISNQLSDITTGWKNISITNTTNKWRYLRLRYYSDEANPGSGSSGTISEIEVYGEYITSIPVGVLEPSDIGKLLLASDTSNSYSLKVPDNTNNNFDQGWYCYLKATTGNNRSFVSAVNIANISSQTSTPSLNGPEELGMLVNTDGNNQWSFINLSNPSTKITSETTASETITLTNLSESIQIINPNGANREVVLPDPPIKDLYFKIINADPTYTLSIKETSSGPVVKVLDEDTPYVEVHRTNTQYIILD